MGTFVDLSFLTGADEDESISMRRSNDDTKHSPLRQNRARTAAPFILSGRPDPSTPALPPASDALPIDWMHQTLGTLGCHPLRHICLPGSHDAGMSDLTHSTFLSVEENTLTQWADIAGQLSAGIRYFDLRPVISAGIFVSGHYSKIGDSWIGGNGQSLSSIIDQVNAFLSNNKELVILDLSHMSNTDEDWRGLDDEEYGRLFTELERIEHRCTSVPLDTDLSVLPLSSFISDTASVIVIISDAVPIPLPPNSGIFPHDTLHIFNSFANTPLASAMRSDQIEKLAAQRTSRDSPMFLLSWTLTTPLDIRGLATQAHELLFEPGDQGLWSTIIKQKDKGTYPNIIMVDGIGRNIESDDDVLAGGGVLTKFAMAVNSMVLDGVACS